MSALLCNDDCRCLRCTFVSQMLSEWFPPREPRRLPPKARPMQIAMPKTGVQMSGGAIYEHSSSRVAGCGEFVRVIEYSGFDDPNWL